MVWSNLPSDVLGNIAKRIEHITHFQQFSLVCRSWYECSVENRGHLPRRPPLVMLPYDEDTKTCNLLSINKGPMQLHLPELSGAKWCCGASKGWLVLIDTQYNISLLNPFTRVELQLPQHPAFPDMMPDYSWHGPWKNKFIPKAVLSSAPDSPDCVVMLIVSGYCILSFCKLVEGKWKTIQAYSNGGEITWFGHNANAEGWIPGRDYMQLWSDIRSQLIDEQRWFHGCLYMHFQDIIWFRGKVYAAHEDKHATICDVDDLALEEIRWPPEEYHVNWYTTFRYLVESRGELLLVIRYVRTRPKRDAKNLPKVRANRPHRRLHRTQTFSVFSLAEKNSDGDSTRRWTKLDSIEDRCLFLAGVSESTCCSVLDFPQLRANSIYFADNFWDACFRNMYGCLDVGVFSLETGTIESLFEDQPFFANPIYFI